MTCQQTLTTAGVDVGAPAVSATTQRALERVSVSPPYFGFTDIEMVDGLVTASVAASPPSLPEVGAVAADQVARHLAILGSCAAALSRGDDKRNHYLALTAGYRRESTAAHDEGSEPLVATASATWQDKRTVAASMTLATASGEVLNTLDVSYAVMAQKMFTRFNPPIDATRLSSVDPVDTSFTEKATGHVVMDCGPIAADLCAGHFPDHPTAPVALVMGQLVLTARHAMCSHLGEDLAYRVESGTVEATSLAQAGQRLVLEATYDQATDEGHLVHGIASADDEQIGAVAVYLAALAMERS